MRMEVLNAKGFIRDLLLFLMMKKNDFTVVHMLPIYKIVFSVKNGEKKNKDKSQIVSEGPK